MVRLHRHPRSRQMSHRFFGTHRRPLEGRWQKPWAPVVRSILRHPAWIGNRHIGRQVLVLAAQCIRHPRAQRGKPIQHEARREEVLRWTVGVGLAGQGVHKSKIIRQLRQMRDHVAHPLPRLPPLTEGILRPCQVPGGALKRHRWTAGQRLVVPLDQLWLVIPSLQLAHRPRAENDDHVLGLRREVRAAWRIRPRRVDQGSLRGQQAIRAQQTRQRHRSQRCGGVRQEPSPVEEGSACERDVFRGGDHGGASAVNE